MKVALISEILKNVLLSTENHARGCTASFPRGSGGKYWIYSSVTMLSFPMGLHCNETLQLLYIQYDLFGILSMH